MYEKMGSMNGALSRRDFVRALGCGTLGVAMFNGAAVEAQVKEELYVSKQFTPPGSFTSGIEGPACDWQGNLYCVKPTSDYDIAKVTPDGKVSVFITLPGKSMGNGIRFNSKGDMFINDHNRKNIFRVKMKTKAISVFAYDERFRQPNDICFSANDILFATDLDGSIWRIDTHGKVTMLDNITQCNGLDISPDEKTIYFNGWKDNTVYAYDLMPDGMIKNRRRHFKFDDDPGNTFRFDGMRIDAAGNLFMSRLPKGVIEMVSADGKLVRSIPVSSPEPTHVTFGGPDGRTCYAMVRRGRQSNVDCFRTENPGRDWILFKKWGLL